MEADVRGEGPANGFTNIPISVYRAIATMTTVGFGYITPKSATLPEYQRDTPPSSPAHTE